MDGIKTEELTIVQVNADIKLLLEKAAPWITVSALRAVAFPDGWPEDPQQYLEGMAHAFARVVPMGGVANVVEESE